MPALTAPPPTPPVRMASPAVAPAAATTSPTTAAAAPAATAATSPATTATGNSRRAQPLKIHLQKKEKLHDALDAVLQKWAPHLPGVSFGVTTAEGAIYAGYAGDRVYEKPEEGQIGKDTTYMLYSMSKLITSLAVLQHVDAGVLSYDDPATVEKYAPELVRQKVLLSYDPESGPVFEERKVPLTLRHLVTHTSGLMYWPFDATLSSYLSSLRTPVMYAPTIADLDQPLRFQPGDQFSHGPGLDWAGVILERATGKSLEQLYREKIFEPLHVSPDTTFENRPDILERWQRTVHRNPELKLEDAMKPTSGELSQLKGGDGLWSTLADYLAILAGVLASENPGGIICPTSQKLLFSDALPATTSSDGLKKSHEDLAGFLKYVGVHGLGPDDVGHSVASLVTRTDAQGKRRAGSAAWIGAARTEFSIDPRSGVGFVAMTQIERPVGGPYDAPEPFTEFVSEMERTLYERLHLA